MEPEEEKKKGFSEVLEKTKFKEELPIAVEVDGDEKGFNFDHANLADQITVVGELEHIFYHANKSASVVPKKEAAFYQTVADMTKEFRRNFMRRHFPNVKDEDWCLVKAIETVRQRVYESAHTSYEDLKAVNDLWSVITEHIFGVDMSGCSACAEDKEAPQE